MSCVRIRMSQLWPRVVAVWFQWPHSTEVLGLCDLKPRQVTFVVCYRVLSWNVHSMKYPTASYSVNSDTCAVTVLYVTHFVSALQDQCMRWPKNHSPPARQSTSEIVRHVRSAAGTAAPQQSAGNCVLMCAPGHAEARLPQSYFEKGQVIFTIFNGIHPK